MASTRLRDPATGRFISAESPTGVRAAAGSLVVTEPAPATKKHTKKQDKRQGKKQSAKNKKKDKKKKKKKKG